MIRGGTPDEKFTKRWLAPVQRTRTKSACSGKATYSTPGVALKIGKRDRRAKGNMNVYHCGPCGGYHLGHNDPGAGRKNRT